MNIPFQTMPGGMKIISGVIPAAVPESASLNASVNLGGLPKMVIIAPCGASRTFAIVASESWVEVTERNGASVESRGTAQLTSTGFSVSLSYNDGMTVPYIAFM